ncbi:hypothetical protein Thini_2152 [Thiothrix nivea DSM 5205]|uniref:Uncharacterized protein n=1 Tax=Thiothrix nivea (strain ATCC 35100 / DSM 5205 / JP2) TaxID=870187 RepID=A0A656HHN0_THINJ|nr:hypothetical protein Thini_2152 [Thiothrix nivea DSM 5205]
MQSRFRQATKEMLADKLQLLTLSIRLSVSKPHLYRQTPYHAK